MKIQLNNQTAELIEKLDDPCTKCPFNKLKYNGCPYLSETVLDCYWKD